MDDLVYRLRKRAEIRRQIPDRKSVQEGQPDRIADLLEEAADYIEQVRADEREACAKVCDGWPDYDVQGLAEAIRARGDAIDISQERVDETAKDKHEWVEQPDLAKVGEVGVWGHQRVMCFIKNIKPS